MKEFGDHFEPILSRLVGQIRGDQKLFWETFSNLFALVEA
jgi:hypothetical protein